MDCVMDSFFLCSYCFQRNSIFVDPTGGDTQHYVEDCQVCCQPNRLFISWDEGEAQYQVDSEPES
jgi:hypothetical protein